MKTIKDICTEYKITQTELSKRFEIPLRTIQDWHGGRRVPPYYVVKMMIEILNKESVPK